MDEKINFIRHYQNSIEKSKDNLDRVLHCLTKLKGLRINVQDLQETGIGKTVNSLREIDGAVGNLASELITKWKQLINTINDNEHKFEAPQPPAPPRESKHESKKSEKTSSSSSSSSSDSNKKSKSSSSSSSNHHHSSSSSHNNSHSSSSKHHKTNHLSSTNNHQPSSSSTNNHHHHSEHKSKDHKKSSSSDSKSSDSKHHKSHHHTSSSTSSSHKTSNSHKRSRDDAESKENESKSKKMKSDHEKSDKKSNGSSSGSGNETKESSSSTSNGTSSKSKKKDHKSPTKRKHSNDEEQEFDGAMGMGFAEALAAFDMPSSSSSSKRQKQEKLADKMVTVKSSSSSSSSSSKTKSSSSSSSSSHKKDKDKEKEKSSSSSSSRPSTSKSTPTSLNYTQPPKLLTQKPKLDLLPDIVNELPSDVSIPDYRPLPLNSAMKDYINSNSYGSSMQSRHNNRMQSESDLLTESISSQKCRTRVFSGNSRGRSEIPKLYEMCLRILTENLDYIECTGGVPFDILKPALEKAKPEQLANIEYYNPYLLEDSEILWQPHCQRRWKNRQPMEMESWREMYERCVREDEEKLSRLTQNIRQHQEKSSNCVQKTKMAFVDTMVKAPRGVARKQEQFGTSRKPVVSPAARVEALKNIQPNLAVAGDVRLRVAAGLRDDAQQIVGRGTMQRANLPKKKFIRPYVKTYFENDDKENRDKEGMEKESDDEI